VAKPSRLGVGTWSGRALECAAPSLASALL
jgi:hypothetical protein